MNSSEHSVETRPHSPSGILRGELAAAKREISKLRKAVVAPRSALDAAVFQLAASAARDAARAIVSDFEARLLAKVATAGAASQRSELNTEQAAEELGLQVTTVRTMLKDGRLRGQVLPGTRQYRIRRADLEEYRRRLSDGRSVDVGAKVLELTKKLGLKKGQQP